MSRFTVFLLVALLLAACGPLLPASAEQPLSTPLSSLPSSATIRLAQTGGFAGVDRSIEVKPDGTATVTDNRANKTVSLKLTSAQLVKLENLALATDFKAPSKPSACADCFNYTLEIDTGSGKPVVMQADDVSLEASGMSDLVNFLRTIMEDALKKQG